MGDSIDPFATPQPLPQGPLPPSSAFAVQAPPQVTPGQQYASEQYPGQQYPGAMPPPQGPPIMQQTQAAPVAMAPPSYPDGPQYAAPYGQPPTYPGAPQYAVPYGQPPTYPGAPQYADRYMQPPVEPSAQQYTAPYGQPPTYPGAPQYAVPYPAPYGSPYATPYGAYAPPAWKRSWGVTMGRWGIGVGIAFVTSLLLGMVAGLGEANPDAGGEVAGTLASGIWMYVLLVPWWLDHIVARLGKAGSWAIHGGVSLLLALVNFAYLSLVARTTDSGLNVGAVAWMVLVMWAVAYGLGLLAADLLPRSYRPKAA